MKLATDCPRSGIHVASCRNEHPHANTHVNSHPRSQPPSVCSVYTHIYVCGYSENLKRTLGIPIQYMMGTITFVDFLGAFVQRVLYQKTQNTSEKHDPNILCSSTKAATSHPIIGIPLDTTAAQILTWSVSI